MEENMKQKIRILLAVSLVLIAGCGEEESYSRYPSVNIPAFTSDDYVLQLSSADPEVTYNAVCNLGESAREMGHALWGEKADPESEKWNEAQHVYTNICVQLQSENAMIVAASLRYLQLFAGGHENHAELVDPVCRIKSSDPLVQFEQTALLVILADETTQIPEPLLRRLLDSKSWIVSRSAYGLIGALSNDEMRAELLSRYRTATDESERLLLLEAYGNSSDPEVLEFLMEERLSAEDVRIRQIAFGSLQNQIETPLVLTWMIEHAAEFDQKEQQALFEVTNGVLADEGRGLELMRTLLSAGYVPEDEFLGGLIKMQYMITEAPPEELSEELGMSEAEIEKCKAMYADMENVLQSSPAVAARLSELGNIQDERRVRCRALEAEFDPVAEEFMEKARTVLSEHGVPEEDQQNFLKPIAKLKVEKIIPEASL